MRLFRSFYRKACFRLSWCNFPSFLVQLDGKTVFSGANIQLIFVVKNAIMDFRRNYLKVREINSYLTGGYMQDFQISRSFLRCALLFF